MRAQMNYGCFNGLTCFASSKLGLFVCPVIPSAAPSSCTHVDYRLLSQSAPRHPTALAVLAFKWLGGGAACRGAAPRWIPAARFFRG